MTHVMEYLLVAGLVVTLAVAMVAMASWFGLVLAALATQFN